MSILLITRNNHIFFNKLSDIFLKLFNKTKNDTYNKVTESFKKIMNDIYNEKVYTISSPLLKLINAGGYATIFDYDGRIIRLSIKNTTVNETGSEKIPHNIRIKMEGMKEIIFIAIPKVIIYADVEVKNSIINYVNNLINIINLLYCAETNKKKFTVDIDVALKEIYQNDKLLKLFRYCEAQILSDKICLSNGPYKVLSRFINFIKKSNDNSFIFELYIKANDCSDNIHFIMKNIKLLYLQISLCLLAINMKQKFLHNDLKLNNILFFKKNYDIIISPQHPNLQNQFIFTESFFFKINDFDLSILEAYNCYDNNKLQFTWLSDLSFFTKTLFKLFYIESKDFSNEYDLDFIKYIKKLFIDKKKFDKHYRLIEINENDDNIENLVNFINSDFFNEWKI